MEGSLVVGLGAAELVILLGIGLFGIVVLGLVVWAVIDMAGHTEAEFAAVGSNRTGWLVSTIVLTLVCGLGWIPALIYLLSVRPKLDRP